MCWAVSTIDHDYRTIDLMSASEDDNETSQLGKAILRSAIDKRASDIHMHPMVGGAAIRFRVDGILERIASLSKQQHDGLSRFFTMNAGLDVNPLIAQDGRIRLLYGQREIDVRLSLLPVFDGMRIVCRLLEQDKQFSLVNSGFSPSDYRALKRLAQKSGIELSITGHSQRVGAAVTMAEAGISEKKIQDAGGWATPTMVSKYTEQASIKSGMSEIAETFKR